MKKWKKTTWMALLASGCLPLSGVTCNSIFDKPSPDNGTQVVSATGSMLPQHVKKGEAAVSDSAMSSMNSQQFDQMRQNTLPSAVTGAGGR